MRYYGFSMNTVNIANVIDVVFFRVVVLHSQPTGGQRHSRKLGHTTPEGLSRY